MELDQLGIDIVGRPVYAGDEVIIGSMGSGSDHGGNLWTGIAEGVEYIKDWRGKPTGIQTFLVRRIDTGKINRRRDVINLVSDYL